jgi:hypothetical protein
MHPKPPLQLLGPFGRNRKLLWSIHKCFVIALDLSHLDRFDHSPAIVAELIFFWTIFNKLA